jgi:hypothetical protein
MFLTAKGYSVMGVMVCTHLLQHQKFLIFRAILSKIGQNLKGDYVTQKDPKLPKRSFKMAVFEVQTVFWSPMLSVHTLKTGHF